MTTHRKDWAGQSRELVAVILTLNEEKHIAACIRSVSWCDAVVVWDSFSRDLTCEIAQQEGALVAQHPFRGYGSQRQAAMDSLAARWVFFIDADERASPGLGQEIREAINGHDDVVGWWVPRHNYIFGKLTTHTGWYPDYQMRLLRPDRAQWDPTHEVHERAILDGLSGCLQNVLIHYNYQTLRQFTIRQNKYADMDAKVLFKEGVRPKPWSLLSMPLRHFRWRFLDLEGYKDGLHGLWLSLLMSYYEGLKYVRLARLYRRQRR